MKHYCMFVFLLNFFFWSPGQFDNGDIASKAVGNWKYLKLLFHHYFCRKMSNVSASGILCWQVTKGKAEQSFFSLPEFEEWKRNTENWHTWKVKYYKGHLCLRLQYLCKILWSDVIVGSAWEDEKTVDCKCIMRGASCYGFAVACYGQHLNATVLPSHQ